jgi:hypothetical protein
MPKYVKGKEPNHYKGHDGDCCGYMQWWKVVDNHDLKRVLTLGRNERNNAWDGDGYEGGQWLQRIQDVTPEMAAAFQPILASKGYWNLYSPKYGGQLWYTKVDSLAKHGERLAGYQKDILAHPTPKLYYEEFSGICFHGIVREDDVDGDYTQGPLIEANLLPPDQVLEVVLSSHQVYDYGATMFQLGWSLASTAVSASTGNTLFLFLKNH